MELRLAAPLYTAVCVVTQCTVVFTSFEQESQATVVEVELRLKTCYGLVNSAPEMI